MSNLTLPGLIDPHVHLRDPGQTQKEDFYTGTSTALAGGYTTILDMPNNKVPITTSERLYEKIKIAKEKIVCDVGFYFGSLGNNLEEFEKVKNKVMGLKLYLNQTTGNLKITDLNVLEKIFTAWGDKNIQLGRHSGKRSQIPSGIWRSASRISNRSERLWRWTNQNDGHLKPILVHAEGKNIEDVISVVSKIKIQTHFSHISTTSDLKQIIKAKEKNLPITCGVTPHHLFLTEKDAKKLGPFGQMKPPLATQKDQDFLWKNLKYIDVIESDHAPHTIGEKIGKRGVTRLEGFSTARTRSVPKERLAERLSRERKAWQDPERSTTPFGVPGLETTLPLLLTAVSEKRLTVDDIIRLCHTNPAKIFNIKTYPDAKIEINIHDSYFIIPDSLFTKCGWSPFDGWKVKGKVQRVFIRGKKVFEDGKVLVKPGFGKIITSIY